MERAATRVLCLAVLGGAAPLAASTPTSETLQQKVYRHPAFHVSTLERPVAEMGERAVGLRRALGELGASTGFYDWRADGWGSLIVSVPLLPGGGADGREARAWEAVRGYLQAHRADLGVDLAEVADPRMGVFDSGALVQIHAGRVVGGVPVRDSGVSAVLNHGNLVLLGIHRGGAVDAPTIPTRTADDAAARLRQHLDPLAVARYREEPRLEIVALARGEDVATTVPGSGYDYRLAWVLTPDVAGDLG